MYSAAQAQAAQDNIVLSIHESRERLDSIFTHGAFLDMKGVRDTIWKESDGSGFVPFTRTEYFIMLYWTSQYDDLLSFLKDPDAQPWDRFKKDSLPTLDLSLQRTIKQVSAKRQYNDQIIEMIDLSVSPPERSDILKIFFRWLMADNSAFDMRTISERIRLYRERYPDSPYGKIFDQNSGESIKTGGKWLFGFSAGIGAIIPSGEAADYFGPGVSGQLALEALYKNLYMGLDFLRAWPKFENHVSDDLPSHYPYDPKYYRTEYYQYDGRLGYRVLDTDRLNFIPYASISRSELNFKRTDFDNAPHRQYNFGAGIICDIKLSKPGDGINGTRGSYNAVRLHYFINSPDLDLYETKRVTMQNISVEFAMLWGQVRKRPSW